MLPSSKWTSKFQVKQKSWVFVPTECAVKYGKKVKQLIESNWFFPDYYFHLRSGGHVEALKTHLDNYYFIHLDIKDFFNCINKSRVTRNLKQYFGYPLAREIASYSTVKLPNKEGDQFILPFGFVQSPIIASVCLHKSKLGRYLEGLNKDKSLVVSVYMDDIIISGKNYDRLKEILSEINLVSEKSGFPLNREKEEGPSKNITAFNIELSHNLLKITNDRFKEFSYNYHFALSEDVRNGILGYISSVNSDQLNKL